MTPRRRVTARVLPVNADGQVLLLFGCDPARPESPYWFSIGGGTEPGEPVADAAVRELREETGIVAQASDLAGPIHLSDHPYSWNGEEIISESTFFGLRADEVEVSLDGLVGDEIGTVLEAAWWTPDEMESLPLSNAKLPGVARKAVETVLGTGPVHRVAARLLPVSDSGEVLLLQGQDPARPGDFHWVSVGGAVDPGESVVAAAIRELAEETGLVVAESDVVGPLHRATHPFSWAGRNYVSDNHFYAVPLDRDAAVSFAGLEPSEVGNVLQAAWWTPDALRADGSAASPDLPDILATAIAAVLGGEA